MNDELEELERKLTGVILDTPSPAVRTHIGRRIARQRFLRRCLVFGPIVVIGVAALLVTPTREANRQPSLPPTSESDSQPASVASQCSELAYERAFERSPRTCRRLLHQNSLRASAPATARLPEYLLVREFLR